MADLFSVTGHTNVYSKGRPQMPQKVFQEILKYCNKAGNKFRVAIDLGCGTGQNTSFLAEYFTKIIGIDPNQLMIESASSEHKNVAFMVGRAEDLSFLEDSSVDLVSSFSALHWFDTEAYYREVERVLAPGGVHVACCYTHPKLDNKEASYLQENFVFTTLRPYMDKRVDKVLNQYDEYEFPLDNFIRLKNIPMEYKASVDVFVSYIESYSFYQQYKLANPDSSALNILKDRLMQIYKEGSDDECLDKHAVSMIMGSKRRDLSD